MEKGIPYNWEKYFGKNHDIRGTNDGLVFLNKEKTVSSGSYTCLVGVCCNNQMQLAPRGQFGVLKGICSAMQLSTFFIRPAKWKKYFGLIKTEKEASRTKVIEIFPYISSELSRKKDTNKADAVLIASFFYNTFDKSD